MSRSHLCCLLCLTLFAPAVYAQKVKLQLDGLSGKLEQNVRVNLSTIGEDEISADSRFRARVEKAIRQGLQAVGYYQPIIDFAPLSHEPFGRQVLRVTVTPGEPVRVAAVNITISGEAKEDADYQKIVTQSRRYVGRILNHDDYENLKNSLTGLAWQKGYFDAEMVKAQLGVAVDLHKAVWTIDFDSGKRYRFGQVTFSGSQIRDDYLQALVPFAYGDEYTSQQLAELNHRLAATGWFNNALVTPDFSEARTNPLLPLRGVMTPKSHNIVSLGGGFSTSIGPRLTSSWQKPWLNSRGHSLENSITLSAPQQSIDVSYKIPLLVNPVEQYYLAQAGFKHEDLNDTRFDASTLNLARYWNFSSGWRRAVNLRWSYDQFTQGTETNNTMLLYPGINFNRTRKQGDMMSRWGDTQNYSADVSAKTWGSDVDFYMLQAQNTWIRSPAEKHRFVVRGNLGLIQTDDFQRVPPSLRFFAGGDRSIRGYKFKSISPTDAQGKLEGGSKLATGSLEYQYNVTGRWWSAMFVDSGQAVNSFNRQDIKTGAGVGFRWASVLGPVKFDIAKPIGDSDHRGLQIYIGLGPEL